MYCSKCGNKLDQDDLFCSNCGAAVSPSKTKQPAIPQKGMEEIIEGFSRGYAIGDIAPEQKDTLIAMTIEKEDIALGENILCHFDSSQKYKLTSQEREQLKRVLLKTKDADMACSALLNLAQIFSDEERQQLLKLASRTKNAYLAYHIYQNECQDLFNDEASRDALRKTVVETQDPERAFQFLQAKDDNCDRYEDDLKSLDFSNEELEGFKQVIILSRDPKVVYKFLIMKELREQVIKEREEDEYYTYSEDESLLPPAVIELTRNERTALKRIVIESRDADIAEAVLSNVGDLTDDERAALKSIIGSQ
jgi:hypothetical protein